MPLSTSFISDLINLQIFLVPLFFMVSFCLILPRFQLSEKLILLKVGNLFNNRQLKCHFPKTSEIDAKSG